MSEQYEIRELTIVGHENTPFKGAFNLSGDYIGDPETAEYLCNKRGIKPELRSESNQVCSIGFCEKEQKWYGWSHRAICGFGIGHTVKAGDSGFEGLAGTTAETLDDCRAMACIFAESVS